MKAQNIITQIKEDHRPLKAGIRILKSESADGAKKKKALSRFLRDLKLHAKSEEKALYQNTIDDDGVRNMVLEGYEEHGLADLLSAQLEHSGFERHWSDEIAAKAKVLAELVEHHVKEEEEEMLPELRERFDATTLRELGRVYLATYRQLKAEDLAEKKQNVQHWQQDVAERGLRVDGKLKPLRKRREMRIISHTHM